MIFVDSNIPMYLVGAEHPHKHAAQRLLERHILQSDPLVTDVEVLQEVLHRYTAIGRRDAIQPAFDALLAIADRVYGVEPVDAERAKAIVLTNLRLSARDALHVAVMERQGIDRIMSFDAGFDVVTGLTRIHD